MKHIIANEDMVNNLSEDQTNIQNTEILVENVCLTPA